MDFNQYPHNVGIPWQDVQDTYNLEESVRQIHERTNSADHDSKYSEAIKKAQRSNVQGGRIYDKDSGLFIDL